jgi:Asp-tRNA(Asn)/Glu-tRNA(Gln) amidotransferase B subunit
MLVRIATAFLHRRAQVLGFMETTTILTREGGLRVPAEGSIRISSSDHFTTRHELNDEFEYYKSE